VVAAAKVLEIPQQFDNLRWFFWLHNEVQPRNVRDVIMPLVFSRCRGVPSKTHLTNMFGTIRSRDRTTISGSPCSEKRFNIQGFTNFTHLKFPMKCYAVNSSKNIHK